MSRRARDERVLRALPGSVADLARGTGYRRAQVRESLDRLGVSGDARINGNLWHRIDTRNG